MVKSELVPPVLPMEGDWPVLHSPEGRAKIEASLPAFLQAQRWFRGKAQALRSARLQRLIPIGRGDPRFRLALVSVDYIDAVAELYLIPLAFAERTRVSRTAPVIAVFQPAGSPSEQVLYDAARVPEFISILLDLMRRDRECLADGGTLTGARTPEFSDAEPLGQPLLAVQPIAAEQSNSSARIGDRFILKLYRAIHDGRNPEVEVGLFLSRRTAKAPAAALAGHLECSAEGREPATLAVMHRWIPSQGDAWTMTLDHLRGYFERARALLEKGVDLCVQPPAEFIESVGPYLESARLLGVRTAQLHKILGSDHSDPAFAPEPFDQLYIESLCRSMRSDRAEVFELLRRRRGVLPPALRTLADAVLDRAADIDGRYSALLGRKFGGQRIRIHGDYHLGQTLWTGSDFVMIDFEGEPLLAFPDRRTKHSPLRDVAGMLRSFDYAANAGLRAAADASSELHGGFAAAARLWRSWACAAFLTAYRGELAGSPILTQDPAEFRPLLSAYLIAKAVYELRYEFNNRPDWVEVPLRGLQDLIATAG